jgi:hypothetical protein
MRGQIRASISALAAAVMLVSCASKGPVNPTPETAAAGAEVQDQTASEYKSLVDNAGKQIVCKRQAITGTRIGSEVCMTRAQMEAQRERAAEVMRDIQAASAINRQSIPDRPSMPQSPPRNTP